MTDEEKKTIDKLKNGKKYTLVEIIRVFKKEGIENFIITRKEYLDIILNLIEKQSKEIEELKFRKEESIHITKETVDFINSHYIHKDKIRAKIEEIEKRRLQDEECELALYGFQREAKLEVLQSLLNEGE